jgi:plastocyanin
LDPLFCVISTPYSSGATLSLRKTQTDMRKISTLFALLPFALLAQTTWEVEAGGSLSTPNNLPYYSPMDLVINVGDIVLWTNVLGQHNIYGGLDMFPDNPEAFSSGQPEPAPWTYSHTFNIPGVYGYHCTQTFNGQSHSTTQHGTINVVSTESISERTAMGTLLIYPVPATNDLMVTVDGGVMRTLEIMSLDGRLLHKQAVNGSALAKADVSGLPAGRFLMRLTSTSGFQVVRPFVKH